MARRVLHPAYFVLLLCHRDPNVLLRPRELCRLLEEAGFRVTERMALNYRKFLVEAGYIVIVEDAEGRRVLATQKAVDFVARCLRIMGLDVPPPPPGEQQ